MTSHGPHESAPPAGANRSEEHQRLFDLLAENALGELTPAEAEEMNALLAKHPDLHDAEADALEEAAALLAVAEAPAAALPAALRRKLDGDAAAYFAEGEARVPEPVRVSPVLAFIGGILTTAAALLFVVLISGEAKTPLGNTPRPTPDQLYAKYERDTPGVAEHVWAIRHPGYEKVNGRVAWSDLTQTGFMILEDLPANEPGMTQYQIWIVDPTRDEFPVDGGVFDVAPHLADDGRAYVPIDAKLPVNQPAAFALTLEQPGGVVKSKNPLLVVAPAPGS